MTNWQPARTKSFPWLWLMALVVALAVTGLLITWDSMGVRLWLN